MKVKDLLKDIDYKILQGEDNINIEGLNYNSKEIKAGDVFFCIKGLKSDGHKYAESAIKNGAKAIVCEENISNKDNEVVIIKVEDTRKALAIASSNYYDNPSKKMKIIGITGTNGKTTTAFMMKNVLEKAGFKVGLIGTVANYIGDKKLKAERTTPESLELHKLFNDMVEAGVDYCVMEVSSHSLYLHRVYGINFSDSIFTNLTQDHLDFHKTMENYFEAKCILFNNAINKVINIDDDYGRRITSLFEGCNTYSINEESNLKAFDIVNTSKGISFDILLDGKTENIKLMIPGIHNVYNSLSVIMVALLNNIDLNSIKEGLKAARVPGRCELIEHNDKLDFDIIIDYAHTPDALEKILKSAREFTKGRLLCVFGCGGDRDVTKRPIMGETASNLSDLIFVTSDNPRTEDPIKIIDDILKGISKSNYVVEENRREAIFKAIKEGKRDDVIVIAGKGHEDYQILKDKVIDFDERQVIKELLERL
ncbi:UDP-N-acetylmuramoyl-L-alanyl-D-glutamate--2,6-diaminopimelate ligase [Clostridium cadaveris]|uniref:UDP-N-acetylmuramoyl-L-alanyl-D-glutamate--2, 6-diaminopimelate ligase n=1 Tax=Clostridium cadaveris TaxID=1529 RepID=UPI0031D1B2F0